eukprot:SAG11_NODE_1911_length_4079_cov_1.842462_1_plen_101_part_00
MTTLAALADMVRGDANLRVATMDQSLNDIPTAFMSRRTPMLVLAKRGIKRGERPIPLILGKEPTVEDMITWLREQGVASSGSGEAIGDRVRNSGAHKEDL